MARRSRLEPGEGRSRRRYSKQSSPTGAIIVLSVIAVLLLIVWTMFERFNQVTEDVAPDPATEIKDGGSAKKTTGDPSSEPETPTPAQPAPELPSDVIKAADALFHEAKVLFATANQAEDEGDSEEYKRLLGACRIKFKRLDAFLSPYTDWHAEAKKNNWEIATIYQILARRVKGYKVLEAQLPPGD